MTDTYYEWQMNKSMFHMLRELYSLNYGKYFSIKEEMLRDGIKPGIFNSVEKRGKLALKTVAKKYAYLRNFA